MKKEKVIVFTRHALERMAERKTSQAEVMEAIRESAWLPAFKGRMTGAKVFKFEKEHYGRYYKFKEVAPVFVEEDEKILVITVYTFFSQGGRNA